MAQLREDRQPAAPHECCSMNWVCDEQFDGHRIWILTIVDTLNRAVSEFGCQEKIRVDNGSPFTSKELVL